MTNLPDQLQDQPSMARLRGMDPRRRAKPAPGEGERTCKECNKPLWRKRYEPIDGPEGPGATNPSRRHRKSGLLESRAAFARREFCDQICSGKWWARQTCTFELADNTTCGQPGRQKVQSHTGQRVGPYCGGHAMAVEFQDMVAGFKHYGYWDASAPYQDDLYLIDEAMPSNEQLVDMHQRLADLLCQRTASAPEAFRRPLRRDSPVYIALRDAVAAEFGAERIEA